LFYPIVIYSLNELMETNNTKKREEKTGKIEKKRGYEDLFS
jgi:hypothetical protein